ncbi:hypothetical protein [Paenibacillus dendritiformis]|uniref:Uncharacterized protein n=1 Tax=Paenibacillus dendritiformis C454 TaxID=1131935 RepID=H3SC28_9BACL|nr:hypothetical protein [Paenibacillus dendritiformis]EHQ63542.1 hypothetical protein PDENDC454_05321 [Paenibacillus dendritiformis C454]CAH8771200.1 hypothetical protein H7S4_003935 [Paenibacillus dendritiformis]
MAYRTGIVSVSDVKYATIEISGHMGYELMRHTKPVTIGEMEKMLAQLEGKPPKQKQQLKANLFTEVVEQEHRRSCPARVGLTTYVFRWLASSGWDAPRPMVPARGL